MKLFCGIFNFDRYFRIVDEALKFATERSFIITTNPIKQIAIQR
ncbi:MAG: hypothetical protein PHX44_01125 [Sulfurimonas sp.]|nr:hypothetical protein [Sulfurimonas sp.]MDD2651635.1 hypothetical protein [Sulfurimonas sp.]MDD3451446.1 hypothetical protein [Sulfurimonas sp.]